MSVVTNVILTCSLGEKRALEELNAFLADAGSFGALKSVREAANGGNKIIEANLLAGAFNALIVDEFLEWVGACAWNDPVTVRVFVKEQHESAFRERRRP